ncbi:Transportin-3 [Phytophthora pseudosyringae]|uniref:Transportin-3 n=1 Tax=Phytophthora pseudosyringae TaxID=221518 RepID=A0A8T1W740_9STRA|nr:Transportin-3 [Phytophthora pseudosyringae]
MSQASIDAGASVRRLASPNRKAVAPHLPPVCDHDADLLLNADMDLHAAVDGLDDTLTLLDAGSVDGGAMLGSSVDDMDLSYLSELLHQGEPVPEPASPLSTTSSSGKELAVSSPSGRSDTAESSDDDVTHGVEPATTVAVQKQGPKPSKEAAGPKKAEDRKAKRRAQVANSARRHRSRKKSEVMNLKKEASYLNYQLDFLRSKHKLMRADGAVAEWEEKAIAQRHKRRQAEELNAQLRYALFEQNGYVRNFKAMFSLGSPNNMELNMRRFLHTYTHLREDPQSRARDLASVCTDAKLEMGMQTVLRETEGIPVLRPHISTRQISTSSTEFGASTVAVYAFDTMNTVQIFLAACGAILGCGSAWPKYAQLDSYGKVVDAPSDSIRYGVSGCRYRSDDGQDEVAVESRGLSYFKIMDRCAVLLWDYADDDDLYPMNKTTLVKRDVIGTVVVRPEICEDGVERVVCRSICTKVHSVTMTQLSPDIRRFSESKKMGAQICGSTVYQTIVGHCPDARPISA